MHAEAPGLALTENAATRFNVIFRRLWILEYYLLYPGYPQIIIMADLKEVVDRK